MLYLLWCLIVLLISPATGGQHGNVQPFSDEDASVESLSHCSSFSDAASMADEGNFAVCTFVMQWHVPLFEHVCVRVCVYFGCVASG